MSTTMGSVIVPERADEDVTEGMERVGTKQLASLSELLHDGLYILLYRHDGTDRPYLYQIPTCDELKDVLRHSSGSEFFVSHKSSDDV